MLATYGRHFDEEADWYSHKLTDLWKKLRPIIETAGNGNRDGGANDTVEACVKEVSVADPVSFSFCYPIEKGGNKMVLACETVNVVNLRAGSAAMPSSTPTDELLTLRNLRCGI